MTLIITRSWHGLLLNTGGHFGGSTGGEGETPHCDKPPSSTEGGGLRAEDDAGSSTSGSQRGQPPARASPLQGAFMLLALPDPRFCPQPPHIHSIPGVECIHSNTKCVKQIISTAASINFSCKCQFLSLVLYVPSV